MCIGFAASASHAQSGTYMSKSESNIFINKRHVFVNIRPLGHLTGPTSLRATPSYSSRRKKGLIASGRGEVVKEPHTLSVIVPAYNETDRLRPTVENLLKADLPLPLEVVVVDDGSTDGCGMTIQDLVRTGRVRMVRHEVNQGKGTAVRSGIAAAEGDILTTLDAGLEYDPADYAKPLRLISEGEITVVYGSRFLGAAHTAYSPWFLMGSRFLSLWTGLLYNRWVSDVATCFKIAPTDVWRGLGLRTRRFGIEAETTGKLLKAEHAIYEVPIKYFRRPLEEVRRSKVLKGLTALWLLLRIRVFNR